MIPLAVGGPGDFMGIFLRPHIEGPSAAIFLLKLLLLTIPRSRFRTIETKSRVQGLWGPPANLKFVQTLD